MFQNTNIFTEISVNVISINNITVKNTAILKLNNKVKLNKVLIEKRLWHA